MAEKKAARPEPRKVIRVQYYHSFADSPDRQKEIVRSLGFTRVNQILELPANRSTLAAAARVPHLLRIIE